MPSFRSSFAVFRRLALLLLALLAALPSSTRARPNATGDARLNVVAAGTLIALDPDSGEQLTATDPEPGSPAGARLASDGDGWLHLEDGRLDRFRSDGELDWSQPLADGTHGVALDAERIWLERDGELLVLDRAEPTFEPRSVGRLDASLLDACVEPVTDRLVVATARGVAWLSATAGVTSQTELPGIERVGCGTFGSVWVVGGSRALRLRSQGDVGGREAVADLAPLGQPITAVAVDPRDNALLVAAGSRLGRWNADGDPAWIATLEATVDALAVELGTGETPSTASAGPPRPAAPRALRDPGLPPGTIAWRGRAIDPLGRPIVAAEFAVFGREIVRASTDADGRFETVPMPTAAGDSVLFAVRRSTVAGPALALPQTYVPPVGSTIDLGDVELAHPCVPAFETALWPATDLNGEVRAMVVFDDGTGPALYVGGTFTTARGLTVNRIAKWDGADWFALGAGLTTGTAPSVDALAVFDDGTGPALYAGGKFTNSGAAVVRYVGKWTGSEWVEVAGNLNGQVLALAAYDSGAGPELYATGSFTTPARIARLASGTWAPLGTGLNNVGRAFAEFGGRLYVGGSFTTAGGVSALRLASWDGASFVAPGAGVSGGSPIEVDALLPWTDGDGSPQLVVAGRFTTAGAVVANHVARWDGATWRAFGPGLNVQVFALGSYDDGWGPSLYAGGSFTTSGGVTVNRLARWNGSTWSALGGPTIGVNSTVRSLVAGTIGPSSGLYVGGAFTTAAGVAVPRLTRIARPATCSDSTSPLVRIVDPSPGESSATATPPVRVGFADWGRGVDAATLAFQVGGQPLGATCTSDVDFADCVVASPLPAGDVTLSATVRDLAANLSPAHAIGFSVVENEPPTLSIVEPAEGAAVDRPRPTVRLTYADAVSGVDPSTLSVTWNGSPDTLACEPAATEALCAPLADQPEGTVTVTATVADRHGNVSPPVSRTFAIDLDESLFTIFAGDVRFEDGQPAAGARVWLRDRPTLAATTDSNGRYSLGPVSLADLAPVELAARSTAPGGTWLDFASAVPLPRATTPVSFMLRRRCDTSFTPLPLVPDGATLTEVPWALSNAPLILTAFDSGTGSTLYAGGRFNYGDSGELGRVARWAANGWVKVGDGVSHSTQPDVRAFAVYDEGAGPALYAGGNFTKADGQPASYLARWDGAAWAEAGLGVDKRVSGLATFDDGGGPVLFVAGELTRAGTRTIWTGEDRSVAVDYVATWNGTAWTDAGAGIEPTNVVTTPLRLSVLTSSGATELYLWEESGYQIWKRVAGAWLPVDLPPAAYAISSLALHDDGTGPALYLAAGGIGIQKQVGSTWVPVLADDYDRKLLASYGDAEGSYLYAVGYFIDLPGYDGTSQLRRWDGTSWSAPLGPATDLHRVDGLEPSPVLFRSSPLARWQGGAWVPLATAAEIVGAVSSVAFVSTPAGEAVLFAGPSRVGALELGGSIARWDGSTVTDASAGFPNGSKVVQAHDGLKRRTYGIAMTTGEIAEWNGIGWTPIGAAIGAEIRDLDWIEVGGARELYAAGTGVFRWDGSVWQPLPGGQTARAIEGFAGALYTDGQMRWDGVSWSPMGSSLREDETALAGPAIFADAAEDSGSRVSANAIPASRAGSSATTNEKPPGDTELAPQYTASCAAVLAFGGKLHFGGSFYNRGGALHVGYAAWNGSGWDAGVGPPCGYYANRFLSATQGQSPMNGAVCALEVFDDGAGEQLLLGGDYASACYSSTSAGLGLARNLNLGSGVDGPPVLALASGTWRGAPAVAVGGAFGEAGGEMAGRLAIWHPAPDPETCTTSGLPPTIVVTSPAAPWTREASVAIAGHLDEPATLTVDGTSVPVAPDLTFAFPSGPLREGVNDFFLRAVDRTDRETTLGYELVRDSIAPALTFQAPPAGARLFTDRPTFELAFADGGSGIDLASFAVAVGGSTLPASDCALREDGARCRPTSPIPPGPTLVTATVADRAGNFAPDASLAITVDPGATRSTTVVGVVRKSDGASVSAARVRVLGRSGVETASLADGGFAVALDDLDDDRPIRVVAEAVVGPDLLVAVSPPLVPVAGGVTDAGVLVLGAACDLEFAADLFGSFGVGARVRAAAVYDDGSGPALYLGGEGLVSISPGVTAGVAKWTGDRFDAVPGAPGSGVWALASFDDGAGAALYVGGTFTAAGGASRNGLARWNGTVWADVGGGVRFETTYNGGPCTAGSGTVTSLHVFDDGNGSALYVGGLFSLAGGSATDRVARWSATGWQGLGAPPACWPTGVGYPAARRVYALASYDDGGGPRLYAAGDFGTLGGAQARGIARLEGTSWQALGRGLGRVDSTGNLVIAQVNALAVYDSGEGAELVAAGLFNRAGDSNDAVPSIARWNGERWAGLGDGLAVVYTQTTTPTGIQALAVFDDGSGAELYALGKLTEPDRSRFGSVARWNGALWRPAGGPLLSDPGEGGAALLPHAGRLVAGAGFATLGGVAVRNVAAWDGQRWSSFGSGLDADVEALAVFDDGDGPAVYLGGSFTSDGSQLLSRIARWDGSRFHPLGSGVDGTVYDLEVFEDATGSTALYLAGSFLNAGGAAASRVARWDGASFSALGSGVGGTVYALEPFHDGTGPALYAGGAFSQAGGLAASNIAKWQWGAWAPLGAGVNNEVYALARARVAGAPEALYVGGKFTSAGGAAANRVASWRNGWSRLGNGVSWTVRALTPWSGDRLLVAGDSTPFLWNGWAGSSLPGLTATGVAETVALWDDGRGLAAYLGGMSYSGSPASPGAVRWNGTASSGLSTGFGGGGKVKSFAALDEADGASLYVGGGFDTAGGLVSSRLARWHRPLVCQDTAGPAVTITQPAENAWVGLAPPEIRLTVSDPAGVDPTSFELALDGQPIVVGCTLQAEEALCQAVSGFPAGGHGLRASARDTLGNLGSSPARFFSVDAVAPTLAYTAPADGSIVLESQPTLALAYSDGESGIVLGTFDLELAGTGTVGIDCTLWPANAICAWQAPLPEGRVTVDATIADAAGNQATDSVDFVVDTAAPALAILRPAAGSTSYAATPAIDVAVEELGSGLDVATVLATLDGSALALSCTATEVTLTCTPTQALGSGPHDLRLSVADRAGRRSAEAAVAFTSIVDTTPPALAFVSPAPGGLLDPQQEPFELAWSDDLAGVDSTSLIVRSGASQVTLLCDPLAGGTRCRIAERLAGEVTLRALVADLGGNLSAEATVTFTNPTALPDATPPTIRILEPADPANVNRSPLALRGALSEAAMLTLDGLPVPVFADRSFVAERALAPGSNTLELVATDLAGNLGQLTLAVELDSVPPEPLDGALLTVGPSLEGEAPFSGAAGSVVLSEPGLRVFARGAGVVGTAPVAADGGFAGVARALPGDTLAFVVVDRAGNESAAELRTVEGSDPTPRPPDPSQPGTDRESPFCREYSFVWTGAGSIQHGVAERAIDCARIALVRGQVLDAQSNPIARVRVSAPDERAVGVTLTRDDGWFDLALHGGGRVVLELAKSGYLPVQRAISVPEQTIRTLEPVVLMAPSATATTLDLSAPGDLQSARGDVITDADGTRRATLLVPGGTTATADLPGGGTLPLPSITVRATEYTVGDTFERALPGPLPPMLDPTYVVDLAVDEAAAAGAEQVRFSQPLPFYVENFAGIPTGTRVAAASWSRSESRWRPEADGNAIEILGEAAGVALLDVAGSGVAADDAALAELGITLAERRELATLYEPGQRLLRGRFEHLTPWYLGIGMVPSAARTGPPNELPLPDVPDARRTSPLALGRYGGLIDSENRILLQRLPILGSPLALTYASDRVRGRKAPYRIEIPLTGPEIDTSLRFVEVVIEAAGKTEVRTFDAAPNLTETFEWDGIDAYGQRTELSATWRVRVDYLHTGSFAAPGAYETGVHSFDLSMGRSLEVVSRSLFRSSRQTVGLFPTFDAERVFGLGGWNLDALHRYDTRGKVVIYGDGRRRSWANGPEAEEVLVRVAGTGAAGSFGDGYPAREAELTWPTGITSTSHGELLIADSGNCRIRSVDRHGFITTVAGTDCSDLSGNAIGDGGPATQARLNWPLRAARDRDGNLWIADSSHGRVRRVDRDTGIITTAANFDTAECPTRVWDLDLGPDDKVYVVVDIRHALEDPSRCRGIWAISPAGVVSRVTPEHFPTPLNDLRGLDVLDDGRIAYSKSLGLFETNTAGADTATLPGSGSGVVWWPMAPPSVYFRGDGQPATYEWTRYFNTHHVAVAPDGTTYLADSGNGRIRVIRPDRTVQTLAGGGPSLPVGDGFPPSAVALRGPTGVALTAAGSILYFVDNPRHTVWKIAFPSPEARDVYEIPSEDGSTIDVFDLDGYHLRTESATTGRTLVEITYQDYSDPDPTRPARHLVTEVRDDFGNVLQILRGVDGTPQAIVAPFGQRTDLTLDGEGFLRYFQRRLGSSSEIVGLDSTEEGLLTSLTDPNNGLYSYQWDELGRLALVDPPGATELAIETPEEGDEGRTTIHTSVMDRASTLALTFSPKRELLRTAVDAAGGVSTHFERLDGRVETHTSTEVSTVAQLTPDPVYGPFVDGWSSATTSLPSGLSQAVGHVGIPVAHPEDPYRTVRRTDEVTVNGRTGVVRYDSVARTLTTTSPSGRTTLTRLDERDRPVRVEMPGLPPTDVAYDARGRVERVERSVGGELRRTTYGYHPTTGYLETVTDPLGRTTSYETDDAGRVTKQILPDLREVRATYDGNGNLTSLTPPTRPSHAFDYTPIDQLEVYTPPEVGTPLRTMTYVYNGDGQLAAITRPDNLQLLFTYEPNGRLDFTTLPTGTVDVGYDSAGRVASIAAPGGVSHGIGYDGPLVVSMTTNGPVAGTVGFTYDADFRLASRTINTTSSISFGYDSDSLLVGAGALSLTRNPTHGLLEATALGAVTDAVTRTPFAELDTYAAQASGGTLLAFDLDRDSAGRITRKTETVSGTTHVWDYTYHAERGWLAEVEKDGVVVETYGYDGNGNRTAFDDFWGAGSATYDDQDRLLTYGDTTYTYTANGELRTKTQGPQSTTYTYDVRGALLQVQLPTGIQIDYVVDASGRRIGKKVNGVLTQGWLYAGGLAPVAETDGTGTVRTTYVYATKSNVPDYFVRQGTLYRILTDHLGSVRLVVDADSGLIVQRLDYDPWGRITFDSNPGFQPFAFAGGLYDPSTGLVRFGARDYDPEIGRWTAKDPIGFGGGSALLYEYCGNDPANAADPTGLWITPWEALDLWSYQQSSAEFSRAVEALSSDPSWGNALWSTTSLITAMVDGAALLAPVVPAAGGLAQIGARAGVRAADAAATAVEKAGGIVRHGPMNPGPLPDAVASTFRSSSYFANTLGESTTLYRVHGGSAGSLGPFWTRTPPAGPLQARIDLALRPEWGNTATEVTKIRVPAGTTIFEGFAASQRGLVGGGSQVFIPRVDPAWVVP